MLQDFLARIGYNKVIHGEQYSTDGQKPIRLN